MAKSCVICGGDEASGETLLEAPCQRHWVCTNDVGSFFKRATENESLYPPKCCGQHFLLDVYEAHVPFELAWAFQMKAQGEYSVLAKYRVYCANPACSKFLNPAMHVRDPSTNISYGICQDDSCGKLTCTTCKTLMNGVESHICEQNDDYKKFRQTATEKGFQECPTCASTVELAEACNHITCGCGAQFCYICGEEWKGIHGCPHYGPAVYNEEGYNQDGYHRSTGLNREGRTRREQALIDREDEGDSEDEDGRDEDEDADEFHPVLQHVEPGVREAFATLPHDEREMFLINLQIQLFEDRGITFAGDEDGEGDSDGEGEDDDRSENDSEAGNETRDDMPRQAIEGEAEDEVTGNDDAEQGEGRQHGPAGANMAQNASVEAANGDLAEALRLMEEFAQHAPEAAGVQNDDNRTTLTVAMSAPATQGPEDPAELETSVAQYLTQLSLAFSGNKNGGAGVEDDLTALDRRMSGAELADTLQRMQGDLQLEAVARIVIFEALKILHFRFPDSDEILRVGHTLSDLIDKDQETSSTIGTDEQAPSTPMEVDSAITREDEKEREPWMEPPGGWPDDEEL